MPIDLFSMVANHQIRHHAQVTWAAALVIADGQLIFLRGLCGYVWADIHT